jgi:hypothetical protein
MSALPPKADMDQMVGSRVAGWQGAGAKVSNRFTLTLRQMQKLGPRLSAAQVKR